MASESTEEGAVTVSLAPELEEWLDARAAELGADRETALLRIVAASRAADVDDAADADALADALADAEPVRDAVESAADEVLAERLGDRLQSVQSAFQTKLEDVRERVVQVKQETDAKAPGDHTHEELARVDSIGGRLADVEQAVRGLEGDLEALAEDVEAMASAGASSGEGGGAEDAQSDLVETVDELQERLQTVAWVVNDLREAEEARAEDAGLAQLKQAAAAADVSRAKCERCGEGVEVGLLTEPSCPHCGVTVTDVAPASGFFGKPTLVAAAQLEAGEE